jgi:hypothetical protein
MIQSTHTHATIFHAICPHLTEPEMNRKCQVDGYCIYLLHSLSGSNNQAHALPDTTPKTESSRVK